MERVNMHYTFIISYGEIKDTKEYVICSVMNNDGIRYNMEIDNTITIRTEIWSIPKNQELMANSKNSIEPLDTKTNTE